MSQPSTIRSPEEINGVSSVEEFIQSRGLGSYLNVFQSLIEKHFSPSGPLELSYQEDPEIDDKWISVTFGVKGDIPGKYRSFKQAWLSIIPRDLSGFMRVSPVVG